MYDYHYDNMMSKYGANAMLMMTNTDSVLYYINTEDIHNGMQTDNHA